ncbi:FHA domain-containing protein At4g14490-like [Salvia hispanica]|uniref:FHA domain-containing protein At4g14490-like n=1 Tax=Salvia hispanica TaxID=49212 RepID=UPI002009BD97|nr:FHA domain-containing protein At4g14490-like [Salvia hispanica]
MPPRRSAAARGGAQGPTLKLIVDKGPLSGNTSEFRPGTAVKIGRLVRGNTLAIKDSGISTKHLLIQAEDAPDRRWTVSDLDSSNGSFLNDAQLEPFEAAVLSHGDVIKIGEETSIRVEILSGEGNEVVSVARRNTRRRGREQVVDLGVIDEFAELGLQNNVDEEKIEVEVNQGRNANTRTTRNTARSKNLAQDLNVEEDKVVSTRMTRNSARNLKLAVDLNVEEDNGLEPSEIKGSRGVSTRRKRREDNVEETVVDSSLIEGKKATRGGGRGRKKLIVETICEETENEEAKPESKEKENRSDIAADEVRSSGVEECVAAGATTSKGEMVADLSKMTLGEWLDFVAVYEPQQIIAETEEMLAEMRRKAERCHEFMLQQKKAQG